MARDALPTDSGSTLLLAVSEIECKVLEMEKASLHCPIAMELPKLPQVQSWLFQETGISSQVCQGGCFIPVSMLTTLTAVHPSLCWLRSTSCTPVYSVRVFIC